MIKFKNWLPLAIAITVISLLAYILAQQNLRMSANDPQVEISEELANAVTSAENVSQFDPPQKSDIAKSLSAFWIIYDEQGKPLAGTGQLNNKLPELPKGVFEKAKTKGENRVTWQPQAKIRFALVIRPYSGKTNGFVVAGRSLREVEKRNKNLLILTFIAWLVAMSASLAASLFVVKTHAHHLEHPSHQNHDIKT